MTIQSVERAIDILQAIADRRSPMGLPELSETLELPKTTIHTLVKTLKKRGMVLQNPLTKKYELGFALYELGTIQVAELDIQRFALPVLEKLANELDVETRLGVWDQNSVMVIQYAQPVGTNQTRRIGPRIPGYCTALGKAILAYLPKNEVEQYLEQVEMIAYTDKTITDVKELKKELEVILQKKYVLVDAELTPFRISMGAPVFGSDGNVQGAISVSLDNDRHIESIESLANSLRKATYKLSEMMGCPAFKIH